MSDQRQRCPASSAANFCKTAVPATQRCGDPNTNAFDIDESAYEALTGTAYHPGVPNLMIEALPSSCSPKVDVAKQDLTAASKVDGAKEDLTTSPKVAVAKQNSTAAPEVDVAKQNSTAAPEVDVAKQNSTTAPEVDVAKQNSTTAPKSGRCKARH